MVWDINHVILAFDHIEKMYTAHVARANSQEFELTFMRKPNRVIRNIRILSMTTTFSMNGPVDIEKVANCDRVFEYEPSMYPGLIFRKKEPRIGFIIFSSGKVVCTGGKNLGEVRVAMNELFVRLRDAGCDFESLPEPQIRNLVAVTDFGRKIDIASLSSCLCGAIYEPEQFPAIIYRTGQGKLVVLIFNSGKAILTGARTYSDLNFAYDAVKRILDEAC